MRTIQRDIVGAFIFSSDGKLLMGKSRKGGVYKDLWIVPGGGVEDGETKLQALSREIIEETGLDINQGKIEEIKGDLNGESEKTLRGTEERVLVKMNFYSYKVSLPKPASEIDLKADDDFIDAQWFMPSELPKLSLSPPTIASLKRLRLLN
jgi:8-oxo-dGTP diphosphatase